MTWTRTYSAAHRALATVGGERGVTPSAVRAAIALLDVGGEATTPQLVDLLAIHRSQVHRAGTELIARGFANATALDGKPTRHGTHNRYRLNGSGIVLAQDALWHFDQYVAADEEQEGDA